jgi:phosphoribosylamine--glycine ligase
LRDKTIEIDEHHAVTVALVSGGYPGEYKTGKSIQGLERDDNALIFHAGTKKHNNNIITDGGRVLAVTGKGTSLQAAREQVYTTAAQLHWEGLYYRKDIGQDLLNYKG